MRRPNGKSRSERGLSKNGGRPMTDQQFREIRLHLRILIALMGFGVGIMGAFALEFL
jgi:hypothetical protein